MKREDVSKIIPGITSDQLDSIMNLHGADITAKVNEITTLKAEKTTLTEQLSTANSKLEGYDPEWKAKADAAAQIAALEKGYALERKASGLKFSSESARKAFLTDAKSQNFAMKDGEILGFDDYVKAFKESDPSAILPDGGMARFSASATGAPGQPANTHEAANAAFRAAFGQKG
ncbi:phage scaffolding protein [Faecalibacterium sp. I4-3-84]|uniref:phage scaffolding protein n=1 Tax=Faecalibacterium sp. I4-3-84 TaxID=2929495 RepID=UPI002014ED57|nr:phage scaffolding protein [Faecalibacterium sp. I4-3-84]UQK37263.1 phage scaffolding protein [Faecalibacterium sp. I4-3-84]